MQRALLISLLVFSVSGGIEAQQAGCVARGDSVAVLLYGARYAYWLTPPKGWLLDTKSGRPRAQAVLYPLGECWGSAPAAIYTTTFTKDGRARLSSVIQSDSTETVEESPGVRFVRVSPIRGALGRVAEVRITRGDRWGNVDAIGYFDDSQVVVTIVLQARSEKAFKGAWPAFVSVVQSYMPMNKR